MKKSYDYCGNSHFDFYGAATEQCDLLCIFVASYWHVLCKEDIVWVKTCMEYEVEGPPYQEVDQRGPGERLWKRTVKHIN